MEGVITRRTKMIIDHFSNQIRGQEDAKTGRLKISGAFMNFIGSLVWELATGKDLKDCDGLTKAMLKFQVRKQYKKHLHTCVHRTVLYE